MSLIFQTYFKPRETKHSKTESLKLQNSPILKLNQKDIDLTIKDVYNEILKLDKQK